MRALGVIRETDKSETRVALVPEVVAAIVKERLATVVVEKGAGESAGFSDRDYEAASAKVLDRAELIRSCDCLFAINGAEFFKETALKNKICVALFDPHFHKKQLKNLCEQGASVLSLELIPRISRAQSMDVLSSQANIAGYVAILLLASKLNKVMPLMMTAAGTIKPAKILIVGAGVAGLSAIATAKRLGAVVFAYDVRAVVKEQVESLGAKFVEIKLAESGEGSGGYAKALSEASENELCDKLSRFCKDMDAVVTTAQIPGRSAPILLDRQVFSLMKNDSIIIDMAAASGGNVPGSKPNEWMKLENVWLYGADNLSRAVPKDASFTFSKNLKSLLELLFVDGAELNLPDDIIKSALICHGGIFLNRSFLDQGFGRG